MSFLLFGYSLFALVIAIFCHYGITDPAIKEVLRLRPLGPVAQLPGLYKSLLFVMYFVCAPLFFMPAHSKKWAKEIEEIVIRESM